LDEAGRTRRKRVTKFGARGVRYAAAAGVVIAAAAGAALAGFAAHAATRAVRVTVTEREYRITLTRRSFKPGTVTFVVQNRGKLRHEFEIRGPGIAGKRIPGMIAPGAQRTLQVRLRGGTYTVWCPIHAARGMKTTIKVAGGTGGTNTGGTTTTGTGWA
jgi:plastocyanin